MRLCECILLALPIASNSGYALDLRQARFLCGRTLRPTLPGAAVSAADTILGALRLQAPWLARVRSRPREFAMLVDWTSECKDSGKRLVGNTTQLVRATAAGDEKRVRELVAAGASLMSTDGGVAWRRDGGGGGWTALHWAARLGHDSIAAALLQAADYNSAAHGNGEDLNELVGEKLVDAQDGYGRTPLMLACKRGHVGVARALLAHGARQELQDNSGCTALHYASDLMSPGKEKSFALCTVLCDAPTGAAAGADAALVMQDSWGRTPLHCAGAPCAGVPWEQNELMLMCALPSAAVALALRDRHGRVMGESLRVMQIATITVAAASANERAASEARFAAAAAAAAAAANASGEEAPFRGPAADSRLGELLLDVLPIACAAASGLALDLRQARYLCGATFREGVLRPDGSLDRAGFLGGTADMISSALRTQAPWLAEARALRRKNIVAPVCSNGSTQLMRACCEVGGEQRVLELLAAGAPHTHALDYNGRSSLTFACEVGNAAIVAHLLEFGAAVNGWPCPLFVASRAGHEAVVRLLLQCGANPAQVNRDGETALHAAADAGTIAALLEPAAGRAVLDVFDAPLDSARRRTPLMTASILAAYGSRRDRYLGAMRALLERGALQELQDADGNAALHLAAAEPGGAGALTVLIAAPGAEAALALRNGEDRTPRELAIVLGHAECAAVLGAAERDLYEARFAASSAAAAAGGVVQPFRGPAADSRLGELLIDVLPVACREGFSLDVRLARYLCGATFREGERRPDGSLYRAANLGGVADTIASALRAQAPWIAEARAAKRRAELRDKGGTQLVCAVMAGDARRARELLAAGAPLLVPHAYYSALHHAVRAAGDTGGPPDRAEVLTALLRPGATLALSGRDRVRAAVNHAPSTSNTDGYWYGSTALANACSLGLEAAAEALLDAGAGVDAASEGSLTPLIVACQRGHKGVVRLLLAHGARPGLRRGDRAPLKAAAEGGHAGIVALVCAALASATPGAAAADGMRDEAAASARAWRDAFASAMLRNEPWREVEEALLAAPPHSVGAGAGVDVRSETRGMTLLMEAAERGDETAVCLLLAAGASVCVQDAEGRTALHWAASCYKRCIFAAVVLAPGAADALTLRDELGQTPLALAAMNGSHEAAEKLLGADAAGATVNLGDRFGKTPLMLAVDTTRKDSRVVIVRALLARGARLDPQDDKDGFAALHITATSGDADVAALLCAMPGAAAALALQDKKGRTPLKIAMQRGHARCADVLRAAM
jgi:ankyrin repeat protein